MKMWHHKATPPSAENPGHRYVVEQGMETLVTLRRPVLAKDGKAYRYLHGPVWLGCLSTWDRQDELTLQIGTEATANHIIVPFSNVLGMQECHKVMAGTEVLVLK